MDDWQASLAGGNNSAMWACIGELARRGGFSGPNSAVREMSRGTPAHVVIDRPWRWLGTVGHAAYEESDDLLAARIFLFAYIFAKQVAPTMDAAAQMDVGLSPPEPDSYRKIARSAIASLKRLPGDYVVLEQEGGQIDAGSTLSLANSEVPS